MRRLREDIIHFAVRQFLTLSAWEPLAGQYPNGSDDELPSLNIMDPHLARDNSPDHRRHSKNKLVPDLLAISENVVLVIEMKPLYAISDENKLDEMLLTRRTHFLAAFRELIEKRKSHLNIPIETLHYVPCLAFSSGSQFPTRADFCYFLVRDIDSVIFRGNSIVPSIGEQR